MATGNARGCADGSRDPQTSKPDGHGGRGIPLIAAVMDHLEVVPDSGTTRVRFQKRVAPA